MTVWHFLGIVAVILVALLVKRLWWDERKVPTPVVTTPVVEPPAQPAQPAQPQ